MQNIRIIHNTKNGEHTYSSPDLPALLVTGRHLPFAKEELQSEVQRLLKIVGVHDGYKFTLVER
jgi:hypothetical protein